MVVGFLFSDKSRNTISWLVLLILCLGWDVIAMYNWGSTALAWLYRALCDGYSKTGENMNIGGCVYLLQIWMWEHFPVGRPYWSVPAVCTHFLICIMYVFVLSVCCFATNLKFYF
jgi:hypothetical protein